mmetsp:Transcript_4920/g.5548  ORF Transcript_4920/g.5548 Transcript_4920/m.5548 type:complete len:159 (+) Transcript_4920:70-546(+)
MEQGTDIESSLSKKKAMNGELESAGQATLIKKNDDPNMEVASIGSLFRFATTFDFIIFFLGFIFSIICSATMPAICIAFGDVIDSIAKPINTTEVLRDSVIFMALIGVYGLVTFFFAFFFLRDGQPHASRIHFEFNFWMLSCAKMRRFSIVLLQDLSV